MAIKRPKPVEIVVKLRQVEVLMGQGMPRIDVIRQISVTEQTCYRWKKKWRKINGPNRLPEVIQGVVFKDGIKQLQAAA